MRFAFITNELGGGGAERALQNLANFFAGQGHEVVVYVLERGVCAYPFHPAVRIVYLLPGSPPPGRFPLRGEPGGPGRARGWVRNLLLPVQALSLRLRLRRHAPDLSLSFLQRANFVHILSGARALISEQLDTRAGFDARTLFGRTTLRLVRLLYPRARRVFCASQGVLDGLVQLGLPRLALEVVPNPVDLDDVAATEPDAAPPGPCIVTLGRLAEQKNQELLLRACAPLLAEFGARLRILGEGPLRSQLESLARELGVAERVDLPGWHPRPYGALKAATLFALSSRYEGFGNVLVEAMACGLPVVSTACPSGPAEILCQGECGLLVDNEDEAGLREAIRRLLAEEGLRQHYRTQALARARDFSVAAVAERYLAAAKNCK